MWQPAIEINQSINQSTKTKTRLQKGPVERENEFLLFGVEN